MCPTLLKTCSHKFSSTKQKHDATLKYKTQTQSRTSHATLVSWWLHVLSHEPCIWQIVEVITFVARAIWGRRHASPSMQMFVAVLFSCLRSCIFTTPCWKQVVSTFEASEWEQNLRHKSSKHERSFFCRIHIAQGGTTQKSWILKWVEFSNTVPSKNVTHINTQRYHKSNVHNVD